MRDDLIDDRCRKFALPRRPRAVRFVRHRGENLVRIAELRCSLEHFRMMQQRTVEHAMFIDDQPIVDVKARIENRAVHVAELGMLARRA